MRDMNTRYVVSVSSAHGLRVYPPGTLPATVTVDRARFERLRVLTEAVATRTRIEFEGTQFSTRKDEYYAARQVIIASVDTLPDGDLDPLE